MNGDGLGANTGAAGGRGQRCGARDGTAIVGGPQGIPSSRVTTGGGSDGVYARLQIRNVIGVEVLSRSLSML